MDFLLWRKKNDPIWGFIPTNTLKFCPRDSEDLNQGREVVGYKSDA